MSKKIMLLALAVASVAMFAVPAGASAQELHLTGVSSFSGTSGAGSLTAEGEPTITCESGEISGNVETGGTTGTITFDFFSCHTTVFGFTAKCRTSGSAADNTISTGGTFHFITTPLGTHTSAAIMVTPATTTVVCAGISNTIVHGDIIGTIIDNGSNSVTCTRAGKILVTQFVSSSNIQEHDVYTGVTHALTATTGESGTAKTAGLNATGTTETATTGTLDCT
ncbi:MAG TPA: hypothetical protein VNC15_10795 [Solirubrobacterales bacterium]|nr:hypothetical protein [Solirubrobacterales bacterium]